MPSTTFDASVPEAHPEDAIEFYKAWFDSDAKRYSTLSRLLPGRAGAPRNSHIKPAKAISGFQEMGLDDLIYEDGMNWNLYMGVGLMDQPPDAGVDKFGRPKKNRKGGRKDISTVPGVWVDLDVGKSGAFNDQEEALDLLRGLVVLPTIVVATGLGGVHGYWKTQTSLDPADAEKLTEKWWSHLCRESGKAIDKLTNCDRIMKLPGSIRWPKAEGEAASAVKLLYCSDKTVHATQLDGVSRAAWTDYRTEIEKRRTVLDAQREVAHRTFGSLSGWSKYTTLYDLEMEYNSLHTWHEILEPHGWIDMGQDNEGRTIWARPGQDLGMLRKSAATDYSGSQVMSIFSTSEEVRPLVEVAESGIKLSKYRVNILLNWGGDEAAHAAHVLGYDVKEHFNS